MMMMMRRRRSVRAMGKLAPLVCPGLQFTKTKYRPRSWKSQKRFTCLQSKQVMSVIPPHFLDLFIHPGLWILALCQGFWDGNWEDTRTEGETFKGLGLWISCHQPTERVEGTVKMVWMQVCSWSWRLRPDYCGLSWFSQKTQMLPLEEALKLQQVQQRKYKVRKKYSYIIVFHWTWHFWIYSNSRGWRW